MSTIAALSLVDALHAMNLDALLIAFVVAGLVLDQIITGAIPEGARFAPVFVPLPVRLKVAPEAPGF